MDSHRRVLASRHDGDAPAPENVVAETAIALAFNGQSPVVLMATPTDLDDLVLGFALSEQIIDAPDELRVVGHEKRELGIVVEAIVPDAAMARLDALRRGTFANSACGLCGTERLEQAMRPPGRRPTAPIAWPAPDEIARVLAAFEAAQMLHAATGGAHAAAWIGGDGLLMREDVGRHNAFDKLVGARARAQRFGHGFALVSSRASYELVHKAACAGIGMLVAVSAPTSAAIDLARAAGVALGGFARGRGMTRYVGKSVVPNPSESGAAEG